MSELVLSASSVDAYRSCHYRWFLSYVEAHDGEQSIAAAVGIGVHAGVEAFYRAKLRGEDLSIAEATDVFDTAYLLETAAIADPDEDTAKARTQGQRVLRSYIEDVGSKTEPEYVEQPGVIEINGIPFSFHFDLADRPRVVRDLKVKRNKPRDPTMYAFGMGGYALGYRALTGEFETDVQLDVMIRLKRDRPYHVPISNGGPVTSSAIGIFARQLEDTAAGIDKRDFRPTGLEKGVCKWCPVRFICEYTEERDDGTFSN